MMMIMISMTIKINGSGGGNDEINHLVYFSFTVYQLVPLVQRKMVPTTPSYQHQSSGQEKLTRKQF